MMYTCDLKHDAYFFMLSKKKTKKNTNRVLWIIGVRPETVLTSSKILTKKIGPRTQQSSWINKIFFIYKCECCSLSQVPIISADEPSHPVFGLEEDLTGDGPWLQTEDLVQLEDLKPSLPPNVLHDLRLYMEERRMQHEDVNRKGKGRKYTVLACNG